MCVIFCCMQKKNCSDRCFKIGVHRIVFGVPSTSTAQQKPEEEKCPQIFVRRDVFRKWTKSNFQSIIYFQLIWNVFKVQRQVSKVFRCAVCFNILPSFSQHPQMLQTQYWNGDIVCAKNSSGNWQYMELIISCIWSLLFPSFAAISLGVGLSPVSQICLAILSH